MQKNVADSIGDEYKEWQPNDNVFIEAPTGSGKTYFILNVLLPYFAGEKKKILYLVNRKILERQLNEELSNSFVAVRNSIDIRTYQWLETRILNTSSVLGMNPYYLLELKKYDLVVCDEAHYFLADSNYNSNTILSYKCIRESFKTKIQIYMSATIDNIKKYILDDIGSADDQMCYRTPIYDIKTNRFKLERFMAMRTYKEYKIPIDYSYLDIGIVYNKKDMTSLLLSEKLGKWLVFVDSISDGCDLKNELIEQLKNNNVSDAEQRVAMISSGYKDDEVAELQVSNVTEKKKFTAEIVIATSVLDNGISIHDTRLRNMIVLADTQVELIQMIGRKRNDNQKLKLYISPYSQSHFEKRLENVRKLLQVAYSYYESIREGMDELTLVSNCRFADYKMWEIQLFYKQQKILLNNIFNGKLKIDDAKKILYPQGANLYLNYLSLKNLENLEYYYEELIWKFTEYGEDAYVMEQLRWLGKTRNESKTIVVESKVSQHKKCVEYIESKFEEKLDKPMSLEDIKDFVKSFRDDMYYLIDELYKENNLTEKDISEIKRLQDALKKNRLSGPNVIVMRKFMNFLYVMEKDGQMSIIRKYEN